MDAANISKQLLALEDVRFPMLPSTLVKVNAVINNPHYAMQDLVDALNVPSITVRILQVANSPALRVKRKMSSMQEAVILLGRDMVRNLVVCVTIRELFSCHNLVLAKHLHAAWEHSMEIASMAAGLALKYRLPVDSVLSSGLIHNIGVLPIVDFYDRYRLDTETLDEVIANTAPTLGKHLLLNWEFPEEVAECANCFELPTPDRHSLFDVVSAAHFLEDKNPERLANLGIDEEEFQLFVESEPRKDILGMLK